MVSGFGRKELRLAAIDTDSVQIVKIGIAGFSIGAEERDCACRCIYLENLQHGPVTCRYGRLDLAAGEVAQIEMPPIAPFRKPNKLIACMKHLPILGIEPRLVIGLGHLFVNITHRACLYIG